MKRLIPESLKRYIRILYFWFATKYYGVDLSKLKFIGVTGTSGKTTTSSMVFHLMRESGFRVGLISTVGVIAGEENIETGFHVTTPDPIDLVRFAKKMIENNIEYVVLESSSHALEQGRVGTIKYSHCIYTNIAYDHLDYHKTWERYARAKARMIDRSLSSAAIIINKDDSKSYKFLSNYILKRKVVEYSLRDIQDIDQRLEGTNFRYKGQKFQTKLIGEYNISNALASIKLLELLNIDLKKVADGFQSYKLVEGRMEIFQVNPFAVILDFAHNADSLEKSLLTVKKLKKGEGRLISIFGSAGLRDVEKRFQMGRISGDAADITIITAEDPRSERLFEINNEILRGVQSTGAKIVKRFSNHSEYMEYINNLEQNDSQPELESWVGVNGSVTPGQVFVFDEESINSRIDAIDLAIKIAKDGDVVITNGKGHEKTLAFGLTEYPFSDRETIKNALTK